MGILKPHERVDYDKIREQISEEEELERLNNSFWSSAQLDIEAEPIWYSAETWSGEEYNPDGSKKEPIRSIREREHQQMNAQVASSRRDAIRSNSWNRSACQRKQTRCTNQRGRR